jgi:nucleotide-binding universal stress UspA family protein
VADKILRASNCPVLLVREHLDDETIALRYIIRKILVPLDGSKLGEAVLPPAVSLAQATGAEIVLFQVVEPIPIASYGRLAPKIIQSYKTDLEASAMDYLNKTKDSLQDVAASVSVVTEDKPVAESIIDYSEINHCDLIAMSTSGRSGISRWVFGSVTDKVLHAGKKPVLVVRPKP